MDAKLAILKYLVLIVYQQHVLKRVRGDQVIVDGIMYVKNGAKVKINKKK